jgi:glycosyltransferase involved in cell wall biosynthesis
MEVTTNNELINVIIPVHQAETFLDRCIQSIQNQTYKNIRVILVENGSTDKSFELCKAWVERDNRFETISLEGKSGAGIARNAGLDRIDYSGGYIAFVDSDDYLHPTYLEYLYKLLNKYNADFSWCGVHNTFEKEKLEFDDLIEEDNEYTLSGKELLMREDLRVMYSMVWGKLFKSSLWKDNRFDSKYKYYEDGGTTFRTIYEANTVVISQRKLYNYFYSDNSSIRSDVTERKLRDGIETELDKISFYNNKGETELSNMAYVAYLNTLLQCCRKVKESNQLNGLYKEFFNDYKKNYKKAVNNPTLSKSQRLKFLIYRFAPGLQQVYIDMKMKRMGYK